MSRSLRAMSAGVGSLVLLSVLTACTSGGGGEASCAARVTWEDHLYFPQPIDKNFVRGDPLEGALLPGCNDTNGANEEADPVRAWTIVGHRPSVMIAVKLGDALYVFRVAPT